MAREGNRYILTIRDVYGEDIDEYTCKATNAGGSRQSRGELVVRCKQFKLCRKVLLEQLFRISTLLCCP